MATSKQHTRQAQTLSIVIPVFNEADSFPKTYQAIKKRVKIPHRIYAVYDFAADTTVPVIKQLQKTDPNLKLVKNNLGKGPLNALISGFSAVKSGPLLVVMADLSDDLRDVKPMLELYEQGADIVCGSRYMRGGRQEGGPFLKRTLSRLAGTSLYYLRRLPTHDVTNNFKLYDSSFLHSIDIDSAGGFCIGMEITIKAFLNGRTIAEVPTTWKDRVDGESNFKLWKWLPDYLRWYIYAFTHQRKQVTKAE